MTAIIETFNLLSPQARKEAVDFIELLEQKYLTSSWKEQHQKNISNFAGVWKGMDSSDYNDLVEGIYERRKNIFSRRRSV